MRSFFAGVLILNCLFHRVQVNRILYEKEFTTEFTDSAVKGYDSNQVASNNPLEDRRSEASCLYTNGKTHRRKFPLPIAIN